VGEHSQSDWDPKPFGFDATVCVRLPPRQRKPASWSQPVDKILGKYHDWRHHPIVHDYNEVIATLILAAVPGIESFPCVIPNWDNTPRTGADGLVLHQSSPEAFRRHLGRATQRVENAPPEHRIVFIKSWNEWAEGNHLEPDLKFGLRYLEALREELMTRAKA